MFLLHKRNHKLLLTTSASPCLFLCQSVCQSNGWNALLSPQPQTQSDFPVCSCLKQTGRCFQLHGYRLLLCSLILAVQLQTGASQLAVKLVTASDKEHPHKGVCTSIVQASSDNKQVCQSLSQSVTVGMKRFYCQMQIGLQWHPVLYHTQLRFWGFSCVLIRRVTAAERLHSLRVKGRVLTPISLASSQQLSQEECPHCLLAQCVSMCLLVSETGPGPVISHIYCSSSSSSVGRQGLYRLDPQVLMHVCVCFSGQPTDDVMYRSAGRLVWGLVSVSGGREEGLMGLDEERVTEQEWGGKEKDSDR